MSLAAATLFLLPAAVVATTSSRHPSRRLFTRRPCRCPAATATVSHKVADIPDLASLFQSGDTTTPEAQGEGAVRPVKHLVVPAEEFEATMGRFRMPLSSPGTVADRFGVDRGNGHIHGGIDIGLESMPGRPSLPPAKAPSLTLRSRPVTATTCWSIAAEAGPRSMAI